VQIHAVMALHVEQYIAETMNGGPNLPLVVDRNRLLQRAFSRAVFNQPSLSGVIRYFTNYQSWGFENFSSRTLLIEQHGRGSLANIT